MAILWLVAITELLRLLILRLLILRLVVLRLELLQLGLLLLVLRLRLLLARVGTLLALLCVEFEHELLHLPLQFGREIGVRHGHRTDEQRLE